MIQYKVEQQLQELSELAKTGTVQKLKSQRGGHVEVMVKKSNQMASRIYTIWP